MATERYEYCVTDDEGVPYVMPERMAQAVVAALGDEVFDVASGGARGQRAGVPRRVAPGGGGPVSQLDDILAAHPDGCPSSPAFKRELVILIKRAQFRRRLLGEFRRVHGRTAA